MKEENNTECASTGWAKSEFGIVDFYDKRLSHRLLKLADSFARSPEKSINHACEDAHQSKAAYRFFQNDSVCEKKILMPHIAQTLKRAQQHEVVLAIQDTSYISYKNHKKTQGLGVISANKTVKTDHSHAHGLIMHTSFAVTTDGLPLGILAQSITSRPSLDEKNDARVIEKESLRWIESMQKVHKAPELNNKKVVTVCDREADMYQLFNVASSESCSFVIRARQDRIINKKSLYGQKSGEK